MAVHREGRAVVDLWGGVRDAARDRPWERDTMLPVFSTLYDLDALAAVLAAQRPAWEPGTRRGYHAISLGLYQNELVRRVDPQHRTIGTILAEEFAEPFGLSLYIGLPEDVDLDRVAVLGRLSPRAFLSQLGGLPWPLARQLADKKSPTSRSLVNPVLGAASVRRGSVVRSGSPIRTPESATRTRRTGSASG